MKRKHSLGRKIIEAINEAIESPKPAKILKSKVETESLRKKSPIQQKAYD